MKEKTRRQPKAFVQLDTEDTMKKSNCLPGKITGVSAIEEPLCFLPIS